MNVTDTNIPDVKLITPIVFEDDRGFFFESFNKRKFEQAVGSEISFLQDNHSKSVKGVLRGLHYQLPPFAQGKLVRVVKGEVFDVAVDLRQSSSSFGQWVGEVLSATNRRQLWIPKGFAHGFMVLSDTAEFLYKATDYYAPAYERNIAWNDPIINIHWPAGVSPILSAKDAQGKSLKQAEVFA